MKKAALVLAAMCLSTTAYAGPVGAVVNKVIPSVEVEARYFVPKLDASAQTKSLKTVGGSVDLTRDMGLDDRKSAPELMLKFKHISVDWIHSSNDGSTKKAFTMDNKTFDANSSAKMKFDYLKVNIENDLLSVAGNKVGFDYGVGVFRWDAKANATVGGVNQSASEDLTAPLPMVGLHGSVNVVNTLTAYAKVSGLPMGGLGHVLDYEAGLKYSPIPHLNIDAGYRVIDLNFKHRNDRADFKLSGPFIGLNYSF